MNEQSIVLIEGIIGSGKTTTAQWLYLHLLDSNLDAKWFSEEQLPHPIYDGSFNPRNLSSEELANIYTSKWQSLIYTLPTSNHVRVLEGCGIDAVVMTLLLRDTPVKRIRQFVRKVKETLEEAALHNVLLYQKDIDHAVQRSAIRRGVQWEMYIIDHMASTPYFQSRALCDLKGIVQFYKHHRELSDEIFDDLGWSTLLIDSSNENWTSYRKQIAEYLDIAPYDPKPQPEELLHPFIGRYHDAVNKRYWSISLEKGCLVLNNQDRRRLVQKDSQSFCVEGKPIELVFEINVFGVAERIRYQSALNDSTERNLTWIRV